MQEVQLYIQGEKVDFFDDQNISVTQSIQDVKDPAKIFTDFSKSFNIPASKTNNKIFKHFYNFDITNGFDSRRKVNAVIKINHKTFKKGFIKLEGVKLKDNAPNSYDITFFGETVKLKDILGESKLSALAWLDNFALDYSYNEMATRLGEGKDYTVDGVTYTDAILAPLITHTSRLIYNSTITNNVNNLYAPEGEAYQGVLWSDLKYSIRVHLIILAIQELYPDIVFSDDFFDPSNSAYYNLYMWMHRKKGDVQATVTGEQIYTKIVDGFGNDLQSPYFGVFNNYIEVFIDNNSVLDGTLTFTTASSDNYDILVKRDGDTISSKIGVSGNQTVNFSMTSPGVYTVELRSETANLTFSNVRWRVFVQNTGIGYNYNTTNAVQIPIEFEFSPPQQLPEIKIIDFLSGLFKMFNLTAYVEDGVVKVDTLDNFYANPDYYDISEYLDVKSSEVKSGLPYKQIDLTYEDYKTFLASIFNQLNNAQFGELKYIGGDDNGGNWVGDIYKVKLPFQKMLYERFTDTTIQWGWMADDNQDSYIGKPLIHYVNKQTNGTALSFRDSDGSTRIEKSSYYIPLNSNSIDGTGQSLNFKPEIDEYALITNENTLFENYYKNYISEVFNTKRRISNFTAYLPLKVLLNYNLGDRFVVNGNVYKINSVKTDLTNGKSKLELINEA